MKNTDGYFNKQRIINTNIELFGKVLSYKKGDVVVFKGTNPAIGRMAADEDFSKARSYVEECGLFQNVKTYDSLHFSELRPATEMEKEYLGDNILIILG